MEMDISNIGNMQAKELEYMHDQTHVMFNKLLYGEKIDYTFRELHYLHHAIFNELIRAGGIHVSPIDQLDKIQMLEDDSKEKRIAVKAKEVELTKQTDKDLLNYHRITHEWKKLAEDGKEIIINNKKKLDCKKIKSIHDEIVRELLRRKIPHNSPMVCKKEFILKKCEDVYGLKLKNRYFEVLENLFEKETSYSVKKKLELKGDAVDKGDFEIIEENDELLRLKFNGEKLKGIYNLERNGAQSDVWKLSKDGVTENLSEKFGASLSENEVRKISFLSSNKVGASEIANLLSRPVQTVYNRIRKSKI